MEEAKSQCGWYIVEIKKRLVIQETLRPKVKECKFV